MMEINTVHMQMAITYIVEITQTMPYSRWNTAEDRGRKYIEIILIITLTKMPLNCIYNLGGYFHQHISMKCYVKIKYKTSDAQLCIFRRIHK